MTTDKLTTETKIEILNLVRPFVSIDDMCRIDRRVSDLRRELERREAGVDTAKSEADLREMMKDKRYWRDRDPAFVRAVTDGCRRLYDRKTALGV